MRLAVSVRRIVATLAVLVATTMIARAEEVQRLSDRRRAPNTCSAA